jgi:hypothetical protein
MAASLPTPSTTDVRTPIAAGRLAAAPVRAVVLAAAALVAVLFGLALAHVDGRAVDLAIFGQDYAALVQPPPEATPIPGAGYDGQFFWRHATDPLLLGDDAVATFTGGQAYRAQRVGLPALAWLLAGGQAGLVALTLQLVAWGAVVALVALLARVAVAHGRSAWWGLPLGLMPGMVLAATRGLADPVAVALVVAAVVALGAGRHRWAALAMAGAVLTRETMLLLPLAVVGCAVLAALPLPDRLRPAAPPRAALLAAGAAIAVFAAWQAYVAVRLGSLPMGAVPDGQTSGLFGAFPGQLDVTARDVGNGGRYVLLAVANPLYLLAMVAGVGLAWWAAVRRPEPLTLCAAGFALVAATQSYGDHWSYTRASAPLFALLAILALQRGWRPVLTVLACGALLVPLYPY